MSAFEFLRKRVDLAEVAGLYTDLRPSGRALVGRCPCPDHEDKTPSFWVYPDGRFHCYGCGWHGDVADLWAGINGLRPGIGAAADLARERGIELPYADPQAKGIAEERRQREADNLGLARERHEDLSRHPRAAEWWAGRGFDGRVRERFLLGVVPDGSAATIPYWNGGRVHGLIRRALEEGAGRKYLLPRREEFAAGRRPLFVPGPAGAGTFVVEGYVDALALAAMGLSAVAVGGTRMSAGQREELLRLPGPFYVLPDADAEGREAGRRWAQDLYPRAKVCPPNYEKEA